MGPLYPLGIINDNVNLLIAFFIGILFGGMLEAAGFTNTRKLAGVFYGYDFTVLKVFFTAALTAAVGLFLMHHYGLIDLTQVFYPHTYWLPTLVGAFVMAFGFIIGGFCPGTSFCGAVTGKIDALVFVGGVFIGIFFYAFTYQAVFEKFRNSTFMGQVNVADWLGIREGVFLAIMVFVAIGSFFFANWVQKKVNKNKSPEELEDLGL